MSERIEGARRAVATAGVLGGTFLAAIETTVVAAAMPTVADQLGGLSYYSWVFSAYLLTSTVSIPLWGKLSDLYGRRRFYLWCIGLFLVGSALSGAAQTMPQLILFRAVQGFGAGGLLPLGMSVLGDLYTLEERGRMQGLLSGVWGVASIVGPLTGGYVTELFSWRWVFYLNIPFGIAAAVAVGFALRDRTTDERHPVDYAGAALLMTSVTLLVLALSGSGLDAGAGSAPWGGAGLCRRGRLRGCCWCVSSAGPPSRWYAGSAVGPDGCRHRRDRVAGRRGDVRRDRVCAAVRPGGAGRERRRGGPGADAADSRLGRDVGDYRPGWYCGSATGRWC